MKTDEHFDRAVLQAVLDHSSDPENPGVEEMHDLVRRTLRIAVVGISRNPEKVARRIPSYLRAKGADIVPVNPRGGVIFGREFLPSLSAVEDPVDMVLVFRPSAEAGDVVAEAAARPEKPIIWLQEGIRNDEAAKAARDAGLTVVQDLCIYQVHRALGDTIQRVRSRGGPIP
jgi:predicted CoA-binding protein